MIKVLSASLMLCALSGAAAHAGDGGDALVDLERARSTAIAAHDQGFLGRLYGDDFRGVTATGAAVDKPTLLALFARADGDTVFTVDQLSGRSFGDTAVTTGRLTAQDRAGKVAGRSLYMHVYVRRAGRWVLVAGQGAALPPERPG